MFKGIASACSACFRYRKTNVTTMLLVTYAVVVVLYLNNNLLRKNELLPTDNESVRLLESAWSDLQNITYKPHPYTSHANDVVHDYLLHRVKEMVSNTTFCEISDDYESHRSILFSQKDVFNASSQKSSVIYFESSNILVKIQGKNDKSTAEGLLLSAHFDSVPTANGATDDGKGVVSILALLDYYSKHQPERTIIINLNNNEEFGLLGAHSFFDHPWAKLTKYFINLEGTGTGEGNSILFRTTNVLTANLYKSAVKMLPFGNSIFQQGFNQRLIHSETDYKVYEANGLLGWDIAFYKPRSLYHTARDNIQSTSRSALWNMLSTTWQLSNHVSNIHTIKENDNSKDPAIFFDIYRTIFFAFSAKWLFVVNILLLIIFPLLSLSLNVLARKRNMLVSAPIFSWLEFPIIVSFSIFLLIVMEKDVIKKNPYIVSHSFIGLLLFFVVQYNFVNLILAQVLKLITKKNVLKDIIFIELMILSWFFLLGSTVMLKLTNFKSTGVYPITGVFISISFTVLIHGILLLFSPRKNNGHNFLKTIPNASTNESANSNDGGYGTREESNIQATSPDNEDCILEHESVSNIDERAPLLSVSNDTNDDDNIDSIQDHIVIVPDESGIAKHYEWLLQFLILVPITFIFFQAVVDCLSGLNQTVQESDDSFNLVYSGIIWCSVILSLLVLPFMSKIGGRVTALLFGVCLVSAIYFTTIESFDWGTPLKVRFSQNINGTVEITGRIDMVKELIFDLPSYKRENFANIKGGVTCSYGDIGVCYYKGMLPTVLPYKDNISNNRSEILSVDIVDNDRLSPDRSKYAPINADIRINVPNNRACVISFNSTNSPSAVSAVRKITVFNEYSNATDSGKKLTYKSKNDINELQLHKLNFTSGSYVIGIQWFPRLLWDKQFKTSHASNSEDSLGLNIKCFWGDYESDTLVGGSRTHMIPAYEELLDYAPLKYTITNKEKGLVVADQYIEL
ncbi:similar to Saccharomyces cerevisiae YBR074W Putative metalloprotease [Maudiozyma barnettii]|uniref:Peptide hydrolase n=1 Tax=Maudiozyma barnettii TaxID=61262 RepID=A0A8H2ZJS8_9SACH|nr:Pff1p [Kazachstania barnettii]CAB4256847.1 similar to Saccharomyces cerevisiae YBR074W Putative metalloprotease [Kazachstania barnettii]CAD1785266.1 similar to Saccharomyces cerevisiae YBR074W Putative metalloprotease [Kazachstania barnettii]